MQDSVGLIFVYQETLKYLNILWAKSFQKVWKRQCDLMWTSMRTLYWLLELVYRFFGAQLAFQTHHELCFSHVISHMYCSIVLCKAVGYTLFLTFLELVRGFDKLPRLERSWVLIYDGCYATMINTCAVGLVVSWLFFYYYLRWHALDCTLFFALNLKCSSLAEVYAEDLDKHFSCFWRWGRLFLVMYEFFIFCA